MKNTKNTWKLTKALIFLIIVLLIIAASAFSIGAGLLYVNSL